jgi:hypothetical protein
MEAVSNIISDSTVIPVGSPLEQNFQGQENMSERPGPSFFLTKLEFDRRLPDLVFHNPDGTNVVRDFITARYTSYW